MTDAAYNIARSAPEPEFRDYVALLKPRVMSLSIFTAAAAMIAAPTAVHPVIAMAAIICIAVGAGASGALNMWWDADIDAQMARTSQRPAASGKVTPSEALAVGLALSLLSVMMLGLFANPLSAFILAFTIFFYAVVYTMWLKRSTPQNIVIGGAAGAFPPMLGWAVATGEVSFVSVLLFGLIFLWTPPHFWALALFRNIDYERVGVPMMPIVAGHRSTRRQMVIYSILLAPVAIAPGFSTAGGYVYLATAIVLNAWFLKLALPLWTRTEAEAEADRFAPEKALFRASIIYLFLHFAALMVEAVTKSAIGDYWAAHALF
ncbi:heme o synthase [Rhodovulum sp. DZ06]|uniref:heme o synthase n=1 Tax=Rhodovulum sp. DZ06 TaxID=3425126 RepID=UPI003D349FA9